MNNEELVNSISDYMQMQDRYLEYLEEYFEFIKYRNITRVSEIEHLLDTVLSMVQTDKTKDLYIRICKYYHAIDREGASDYAKFYFEMYEDDTVVKEINDLEKRVRGYGRIL